MFPRIFTSLLILVLLHGQFASAQSKPLEKTLLWKITGNGMQQPSYLFGTMHMQDKRLFRFPDSLYAFIKNADRFYMEIDPQEGVMYVLNEMSKPDSSPLLSQIMDRESFRERSSILEKETGIPADRITKKQAFLYRLRKETALGRKDMETAMDMWLYSLAKKQGKVVGGIEDIRDQLSLFMDLSDDAFLFAGDQKNMESLIRIYLDEDLEKIYKYVEIMPEKDRIAFLDNRNKKMVRSIDSVMKLGSSFIAIGTAHLPGEAGVINLLRTAGYTVTPVFSKKRTAASEYKYQAIDLPWTTVFDRDSLFSVEMPAAASDFNVFGDMLPLKATVDMSTSILYQVGHTPAYNVKDRDSLVHAMAERMNFKTSSWKKTTADGKTAYEFRTLNQEGYIFRVKIIDNGNTFIMLLAGSQMEKLLQHPDIDRFMKSVDVLKELPVLAEGSSWYNYTDSSEGFALLFPGRPSEIPAVTAQLKSQDAEGWGFFSTTYVDNGNQLFYMLFMKKSLKGFYIMDPHSVLEQISESVQQNERYKNVVLDTGSYKNYPAIWLSGDDVSTGMKMRSMQMVRDNRNISLIVVGTAQSISSPSIDKFLNSLEFLPYKQDNWKVQKVDTANFQVFAPGTVEAADTTGITFSGFDKYENHSYAVDLYPLQKYFWVENDSDFYASQKALLVHQGDSVLGERMIRNGNLNGMELDLMRTGNQWRYRIIRNGNDVYFVYVHGSPAYVNNGTAKFLESFRVLKQKLNDSVYIDKSALLLKDLTSTDSAILEEARSYLYQAHFTKRNLPLLHEAILDKTKYDDQHLFTGIYSKLIDHIATLRDESSIQFVSGHFTEMNRRELGYDALTLLAKMKTKPSYDLIQSLLLHTPDIKGEEYTLRSALMDSSELTAGLFPAVLPLLNDTAKIRLMIPVVEHLVSKKLLDSTSLRPYVKNILSYLEFTMENAVEDDYNWNFYSWFALLESLPDHASDALIVKLQSAKALMVKFHALGSAVRQKLTVNKAAVERLAMEDYLRWDVYNLLKENGRLNLFPKSQLTQRMIFQAKLANYVADEYGLPKLQFIGERYRMVNGKKRRYYIYKVLTEDMEPMLGIIGGAAVNDSSVDGDPDVMQLFEDFNTATIDSQLDSLLEELPPPMVDFGK